MSDASGPLIKESSRFFTVVSAATLLVAGLAGVVNAPSDAGEHGTAAAASVEDDGHGHVDDADTHADGTGMHAVGSPGGHADHADHDAADGPADGVMAAGHGDHAAHAGTPTGHDGHSPDAGGHDAHDAHAGCSDDHPATRALVDQVQLALTDLYPDVATLVARGYIPYFDALIPGGYPPGGDGISHWLRPQYIDDGVVVDPLRPETVLLDDWWNPIGMMFITDPDEPSRPVYVSDDGTACSPWHPHTDYPARFGWWFYRVVYDDAAAEGDVGLPDQTPEMMHVWGVHNPHGVYAAHNYPPQESRRGGPPPPPSYFGDGRLEEMTEG